MEKFEKLTAVVFRCRLLTLTLTSSCRESLLKRIDKEGVLEGLFHDIRLYEDGTEREEFVLNQPEYRNAAGFLSQVRTSAAALRENTQYGG